MWMQRKVHPHDLAGYVCSQCVGAVLGTLAVRYAWGERARSVRYGVTQPGRGVDAPEAAAIEAAMTAALILVIFLFLSSHRTLRWTPLAVLVTVAVLVWQVAPFTGTSLNPARSLGPAVIGSDWRDFWVYLAGPLAGSVLAVALWSTVPRVVLTVKLFHDARYRSVLGGSVPSKPPSKPD